MRTENELYLRKLEAEIEEFQKSDDFHSGDQMYQDLLGMRDEAREQVERDDMEEWANRGT